MILHTLNLKISIEKIHCFNKGDGSGKAEPYLWPLFFKIDGESFTIEQNIGLVGFPILFTTNGNHKNLTNQGVSSGEYVAVPENVGTWETKLLPIINHGNDNLFPDTIPGFVGVVVVLMEQDSWPNSFAQIGYDALRDSIKLGLIETAENYQHLNGIPTQNQLDNIIQSIKDKAKSDVYNAIKAAMDGEELIKFGFPGHLGNNDDKIGEEAFIHRQDEIIIESLPVGATFKAVLPFSRRWDKKESGGNGDWEISGSFTGEFLNVTKLPVAGTI